MSKPKAIIVSGYFNPLHKGHLELFEKAKAAGNELWVIVNSDLQRKLKGSKEFMNENERLLIVNAIGIVDKAHISVDKDKTQCATLAELADKFSSESESLSTLSFSGSSCGILSGPGPIDTFTKACLRTLPSR